MKTTSLKNGLIFLAIITTFVLFFFIKLSLERAAKKAKEIERIESHSYSKTVCEQYALLARKDGWYPCLRCGGRDSIYLYKNEVWKYGKTCNEQDGRYPSGLPNRDLRYRIQFEGTEQECLIEEKNKIYAYPELQECRKRSFYLERPPGNKIDR